MEYDKLKTKLLKMLGSLVNNLDGFFIGGMFAFIIALALPHNTVSLQQLGLILEAGLLLTVGFITTLTHRILAEKGIVRKPIRQRNYLMEYLGPRALLSTEKYIWYSIVGLFLIWATFHTIAYLVTYQLVFVSGNGVEYNTANLSNWAKDGFLLAGIDDFSTIGLIFAFGMGIYLFFAKKLHKDAYKFYFLYVFITLYIVSFFLSASLTAVIDGIADIEALFNITFSLPSLGSPPHALPSVITHCYYEQISLQEYVVYINQTYLSSYNGNITFKPSLLNNLRNCTNFNPSRKV